MQTIGRSLPFGLTLGASRRSFYSGTALLGMALALVSGLVLTALQAIERATDGWGLSMHFFRVPYLLNGPWYATWLTSAVGLFALFVYGMWHGCGSGGVSVRRRVRGCPGSG
jgi:predicted lysophospholipase L1 biosynthesis ABC-type transport system permease subunit